MAQSITCFFRRARPACDVTNSDVVHAQPPEAGRCKFGVSKKRRLGHLESSSNQQYECTAPSSHGLVAARAQARPANQLPGMFKAKRVLGAPADDGKHWKCVTRPTLATTVFAGRSPRILPPVDPEAENYTISSTMQSVFDMDTENAADEHAQVSPGPSPAGSASLIPCGMAPNEESPTMSDHVPDSWTYTVKGEGRQGLQTTDLCTPAQSIAAGGLGDDAVPESVHTPPELMLSTVLECPGAPVKRRGDTDVFEVFSRLSSLSVASIDICDSPFAPGAPAWSPRADVRRALRFD